ncbi:MAG TPA: metallophosphoesterase [Pseudobacteroides sp.]|nr:metallophosphoesterase [Pseudobacteroides sp.]
MVSKINSILPNICEEVLKYIKITICVIGNKNFHKKVIYMQIIQISDMHITEDSNLDLIKDKIRKLYIALKETLTNVDQTVLCILGDIVDKGNAKLYKKASDILYYMKEIFEEFNPTFEFTPGNHDLCNCPYSHPIPEKCPDTKCTLEHYNNFVKNFDSSYDHTYTLLRKEYDDVDLLLANSVHHGNCKYGLLDFEALRMIELQKPTLLVTHHTFLSESDTDIAPIRNAYKLFDEIEKKEIIGVLHGHTHGYKDITIGNKCRVIGVGPFLKDIPNINNQANLVTVTPSGIQKVLNYFYRSDLDQYVSRSVYTRDNSLYKGSNIEKLYYEIVSDAKNTGVIPNFHLNINMSFKEFNDEIERIFHEDINTAKMWQDTEQVPESLYYNHGQYMKYNNITAIDFIIKELKSKATSSRAIIPLINFEMVVKSGDGFLPSFDLVQFGFLAEDRTHLLATLYLRALEVRHFLKINLCEIYLMCKQIADEIRSIERININIFAFKAQYKETFGCFKRAEIDRIDESEIVLLLKEDLKSIVHLLEEKRDLNETVIENKGMTSFFKALQAINKRRTIKTEILQQARSFLYIMEKLKSEREKTSNYTLIHQIESQVNEQFNKIIEMFREGDIYEY